MAKQLSKILNLEVVAGKAAPNPPLGPMLGSNGVNIGQFIQEFNGKTMELMQQFAPIDVKIRVKLSLYTDRSFDVEIIGPVTSNLILWKLKQKIGSGEPNKKKIGSLTRADLEEIAALKKGDMNTDDLEAMIKAISGTARNMGVTIA
ncbi:50S ribosomal protein L11 [candidate division SR1 bacterium Aalborg_AAW-1]|nr:50S ribosomal protein L11 [candidate division SR1 bacterium Aalborg_AAW-1]